MFILLVRRESSRNISADYPENPNHNDELPRVWYENDDTFSFPSIFHPEILVLFTSMTLWEILDSTFLRQKWRKLLLLYRDHCDCRGKIDFSF